MKSHSSLPIRPAENLCPPEPEIDIEHVLQRGPVVQVHIDVPGEVDTGVGKVVLPPLRDFQLSRRLSWGFMKYFPPLRDFLDFRSKRWHL